MKKKELNKEAVLEKRKVYFSESEPLDTMIINRDKLEAGNIFIGPAVVVEYTSTIVIPPKWEVKVDEYGNMVLNYRGENNEG